MNTRAAVLWGPPTRCPEQFTEGLDGTLADHQLTVLDDVGPFVPLEASTETSDAVRRFLG